jgi:hypothetical protein
MKHKISRVKGGTSESEGGWRGGERGRRRKEKLWNKSMKISENTSKSFDQRCETFESDVTMN